MSIAPSPSRTQRASPPSFVIVLLAGALRPSPLRRSLDIPVLALPLASDYTLLDAWLDSVERTRGCCGVRIVVSSRSDAARIRHVIVASGESNERYKALDVDVVVDPKDWRGPGGLLKDISHQCNAADDALLMAAEAACLPPPSLAQLLNAVGPDVSGAIGGCGDGEPAGVYAFRNEVITQISSRGFYDIKEQLLPDLYRRGKSVRCVTVAKDVVRIRDLTSYLQAAKLVRQNDTPRDSDHAPKVSSSARVSNDSLLGHQVTVADGAIVHESIVLDGALIGGGAVVSRSVIGPGVVVEPRAVVRGSILRRSQRPGAGVDTSAKRLANRLAILARVHGRNNGANS